MSITLNVITNVSNSGTTGRIRELHGLRWFPVNYRVWSDCISDSYAIEVIWIVQPAMYFS